MKHLALPTVHGLAVVAAMAVIGIGTASASEPAVETEDTKVAKFTGKGGAFTLEVVPEGIKTRIVNCIASESEGEVFTGSAHRVTKFLFSGCTSTGPFGNKLACSSGLIGGEIFTVPLSVTTAYIKAGSPEVGFVLGPEKGTTVATFSCGGLVSMTVKGQVVGKLTPANMLTKTYTLKFAQKAGHQEPEVWLTSDKCISTTSVLNTTGTGTEAFGPLQSGIAGEETLTFDKNIKVKSNMCV